MGSIDIMSFFKGYLCIIHLFIKQKPVVINDWLTFELKVKRLGVFCFWMDLKPSKDTPVAKLSGVFIM